MTPLEGLLRPWAVWRTAPASEMTVEAAHNSHFLRVGRKYSEVGG